MRRLDVRLICQLHSIAIEETGGMDGIRDQGLLESAVNGPFQTFDGQSIYPSLESKAAWLCYALIKNHPFVDGNKRIGILAMLTFLELNGILLEVSDDELIRLGLGVADGSISSSDLLEWVYNTEA
jgi:death-on-curing protein